MPISCSAVLVPKSIRGTCRYDVDYGTPGVLIGSVNLSGHSAIILSRPIIGKEVEKDGLQLGYSIVSGILSLQH